MVTDKATRDLLLKTLQPIYPAGKTSTEIQELVPSITLDVVRSNLAYLSEHGLVTARKTDVQGYSSSDIYTVTLFSITSKGLDFLDDDGGLSSILGVVTIKLHDDTIRDLLLDRVDSADDLDEPAKKKLKDTIKGLPAEALKTVTVEGFKAGLDHLPNIGQWLAHMAQNLM